MHLRKRGTAWHYLATVDGHTYSGNTGEADKAKAKRFAEAKIKPVLQATTVEELIALRLQHLRQCRTITMAEAWARYEQIPRRKTAKSARWEQTRRRWQAFVDYAAAHWPDITNIDDIYPKHAQQYIAHVDAQATSAATANDYRLTCRMVFAALFAEIGVELNPFATEHVPNRASDAVPHEALTLEEVRTVIDGTTGWMHHLFVVGVTTGLREGDICRLTWGNVHWRENEIVVRTSKTGAIVHIPILPPLKVHLQALPSYGGEASTPLCAQLAALYEASPWKIGRQVSATLRRLGVTMPDKATASHVGAKGVHSLRHTYCTLSAMAGVPLSVVQSIVGHMDASMTLAYQRHASREDRQQAGAQLALHMGAWGGSHGVS